MSQVQSLESFQALGTTAGVVVSEPSALDPALAAVHRTVEEFDLSCSRFRDDSDLTALNASAGRATRTTPLLLEAIQAALRAARLTGGDVDPTVGNALVALGYDRDFADIERPAKISIVPVPGWRCVEVDPEAGTVRVPRGVSLDLGATAKALAADRAAAAACREAGCGVLVSLGGDIAIAGPPPEEGWRVRVTDDHRAGVQAPGQWITLRSGGLATSSTTARRWETSAGPAHHLLDPSTGRPVARRWRTATVAAASCLDANTASTAAIVRGDRAPEWLESQRLPSRLVSVSGQVRHLAGWPAEDDDLETDRGLGEDGGAA